MQTKYFECDCGCADHVIRICIDDWEDEPFPSIYLEVQLRQYHSFLGRLWLAIKYIFGYKSKYGHWDCTCLKREQLPELIEVLKCGLLRKNINVGGVEKK